ncbi:MAG: hypothetical protein IPN00_12635 [Hydrogenophilales bacterium]|nr:hypothetical protein [Hydrogenophilales bacterium]
MLSAAGALAAYRRVWPSSPGRDPATWQRDLSLSRRMATLLAQGDGPGALAAYRKGLAIAEALAARDPANTEWQRDLSVSFDRIGNVLVAQGDGPGALAAYRKGLAIRQALAARYPANANWQRDLIVSNVKLGRGPGRLRRAWRLPRPCGSRASWRRAMPG